MKTRYDHRYTMGKRCMVFIFAAVFTLITYFEKAPAKTKHLREIKSLLKSSFQFLKHIGAAASVLGS